MSSAARGGESKRGNAKTPENAHVENAQQGARSRHARGRKDRFGAQLSDALQGLAQNARIVRLDVVEIDSFARH